MKNYLSIFCYFVILLACVCPLCLGGRAGAATTFAAEGDTATTPPSVGYTIVVDPGHGGVDAGAIGINYF